MEHNLDDSLNLEGSIESVSIHCRIQDILFLFLCLFSNEFIVIIKGTSINQPHKLMICTELIVFQNC